MLLLGRAGAHLHADAKQDGGGVDGDRGEQLPHVARRQLEALNKQNVNYTSK